MGRGLFFEFLETAFDAGSLGGLGSGLFSSHA
jgi:hypothetical protein